MDDPNVVEQDPDENRASAAEENPTIEDKLEVPVLEDEARDYQPHYYGKIVRQLFLLNAIIILAMIPFFYTYLSGSITIYELAILILGLAAALINPKQKEGSLFNVGIVAIGFVLFEYYAVNAYRIHSVRGLLFWADQLLACSFLVAFYFSVKTARGLFSKK